MTVKMKMFLLLNVLVLAGLFFPGSLVVSGYLLVDVDAHASCRVDRGLPPATLSSSAASRSFSAFAIAFPTNGSVIDYSPVPVIVNASSSHVSLVELGVDQGDWLSLTRNDDFFLLLDETTSDFWYTWLPLESDGSFVIRFRENGTVIRDEQLHISTDFSTIPVLALDAVHLNHEYRLSTMTGQASYNYTFDGESRVFQVDRSSKTLYSASASAGQKILNSTESAELLEKLNELARFIPATTGTGISEACCDEYYPVWTITIASGEFERILVYSERFQPPGFSEFNLFIDRLVASVFSEHGPLVSWELGAGLTAIFAAIIVFPRKKRK